MIYLPEVAATSGHVERRRRKTFRFVSSGSPNLKSEFWEVCPSSAGQENNIVIVERPIVTWPGAYKYTSAFIRYPLERLEEVFII